jgi:hypothetical protein
MKRQNISQDKLLDLLLAEIAVHIRDVNLLRQQIKSDHPAACQIGMSVFGMRQSR